MTGEVTEPQWVQIPRALLEADDGRLGDLLLAENAEVIVVAPAEVIRVENGIIYVATSVALKRAKEALHP